MNIYKQCARCKCVIPYGKSYCEKCEELSAAERIARNKITRKKSDKKYNKNREKKYQKFYNSPGWRSLSRKYMQFVRYRCEECGEIADEVHHVIHIQTGAGWEKRYDISNLKALCHRCHNEIHGRFLKK